MSPPASARCAEHVQTSAVAVCQRCGSFVCGECSVIRDEDLYCGACSKVLNRPASSRPLAAFAIAASGVPALLVVPRAMPFGLVGVVLLVLGSPVALALLLQERGARRRKETSAKGPFFLLAWLALGFDALVIALALFNFFRS